MITMLINPNSIRHKTHEFLHTFYPEIPLDRLPLIEGSASTRQFHEIVNRALAIFVVCGAAYGLDRDTALSWIKQQNLGLYLTASEKGFLTTDSDLTVEKSNLMEGLYALCWAIGIYKESTMQKQIPNDFVMQLPDLRISESPEQFKKRCVVKPINVILEELDKTYYLHWWYRNQSLVHRGDPIFLQAALIYEFRRHALEWCVCDLNWEDISLDT
jgi:Domain of unknown function (DUF4272)